MTRRKIINQSQEMMLSLQIPNITRALLNRLTHQLRQLIRTLQTRRHPHRSRPVIVAETLTISELRQILDLELKVLVDSDVLGGSTCALSNFLSSQVEVH